MLAVLHCLELLPRVHEPIPLPPIPLCLLPSAALKLKVWVWCRGVASIQMIILSADVANDSSTYPNENFGGRSGHVLVLDLLV